MDMDLLVGPVVLRAERDMYRIFHVGEDRLDPRLTVISLDDLSGGPVVTIGDKDDPFW